ncbi:hypothetical protein Tco_0347231 [Tanacetum coccineum]
MRFAPKLMVNKNLSKPVTQHYLPKKIESAFAKPDHMIASSSSMNSSKNMSRFSSNDMEVNSRAKIQSHKTRNSNKPVDQKSHTQKPGRQIFTGHRFSPNKTSAVYEKTSPSIRFLGGYHGVEFSNLLGLGGFLQESYSTLAQARLTCTSINVQKEQSLDLSAEDPRFVLENLVGNEISLNLPNHRFGGVGRLCCSLIPAKSDS